MTNTQRPAIVCLCGSTRFTEAFHEANLRETLADKIVLTVGCDFKSDRDLLLAGELTDADKERLDRLHLHKIELADEVLILNVNGYFGLSTQREISYATQHNKKIHWLEDEKFWNCVRIASSDECWIWQGPKIPSGYGMYRNGRLDKKKWYAHRFSYERRNGSIPEGYSVLHRCDTPSCVNPNHLFLGTQIDNLNDMRSKGRGFIPPSGGEKSSNAKFKEGDIREIRRRYAEGTISYSQLAKEFGTIRSHIGHIVRRRIWKEVI